ncbi:hypothetical protein L484_015734 [Morus notabilis]|uniref:Uncharacterized protein n=1 Tax=Morus notabilis TaxID=981085 RepID=W9RWN6_9ROSA|nr:hypothetical protein L484_015734 [Morus notabilis]
MASRVATCAGSSGGAQPPPGPHRLPAYCESCIGQDGAKGYEIAQKVLQDGKITVDFDEAGGTWKALGKYGAWFDSAVGIHTRDICEPFHDAWKDISDMDKRTIQDRMLASTETQEPMSAIDNWADMHRRGDSWIGVGLTLSQKHYSGASPSSAGSFSDTTSSAQPNSRMDRYLKKLYREQMKIYDNQVKMLELVFKLQPNIQLPTIARPEPVDLDAPLPPSDDDNLDDDSAVGDAANLDE